MKNLLRKFAEINTLNEAVEFTEQTSFPKDEATAREVVNQLISGNPESSIIKAMGSHG
jgi:hypothetical protein